MKFEEIFKKIKKITKKKTGYLNFGFFRRRKKKAGVFGFIKRILSKKTNPTGWSFRRFAVLGGSVVLLFAAGFAVAGVIGSFSTGDLNKGLVGHWPLDSAHLNSTTNRVDDISGYGNHGTNSGASLTTDRHGQANGAMSFVRSEGDNINCGTLIDNNFTEYSVSLWAKANTIDSGAHDMLISDVGGHWWYISINGARWFYRSDNGSDSWGINDPVVGIWYHIVITHNGSAKYLYIDGIDQGVKSASTIDDSSFSMEIGKYSGSYPLWNGSIADVRAYDRALSEPEIKKLYETYKPKFSVGSANKGLVGHYSFDNFGEWTENLAPYVDYSNRTYGHAYTANSWGGDVATIYYYENGGYNNLPYKKMIKTVAGTGGSYLGDNQYITIEDNKTYAISAWMKASRNQSFNGHLLNINRVSDNAYRLGDGIDLTTAWERYSWIYNSGTGHAGEYQTRHIIYIDDNLPLEIYWSGFQIEEKSYLTPFVDGIRADYVRDNSGYASHATLDSYTPTWTAEDDLHQGVYEFFKGEEKRIRILDPFLYTKTISFWAKVKEGEHTSAEAVPFLVYNDGVIAGSGDSNQILLCMQSNKFRMHGWGSNDPLATSDINDGDWHHLVWHMNYHATDPGQRLMNMWVDGVKEVSDFNYSQGAFGPVADSYWWVGYNSRSYSPYLRDSSIFIDDIRFYDRLLSDGGVSVGQTAGGEIGALYAKGRSGSSVGTSTTNLNKGLVGQWDLKSKDEKVGGELVTNYDTESALPILTTYGSSRGSVARSSDRAYQGIYSGKYIGDGITSGGNHFNIRDNPLSVLTNNKWYYTEVYVYLPSGQNFTQMNFQEAFGAETVLDSTTEMDKWVRMTGVFKAENSGNMLLFLRHNYGTANSDYFYFDNWRVREIKTADSTPYGNHGTIYGADVGDDYTSFDGDDYVDLGSDAILENLSAKTVLVWFNAPAYTGTYRGLYNGAYYVAPSGDMIFLRNTSNVIGCVIKNTTGTVASLDLPFTPNEWILVGYTWDGTTVRFWKNGEEEGDPDPLSGIVACSGENILLGQIPILDFFNGSISNVKIYNRALSAAEVKLLYDKGR